MTTHSLRWGGASARSPDAAVAVGGEGSSSPADLWARASALVSRLPLASAGDHVAVTCRDRFHFATAALACWQRGLAVALPPPGERALAKVLDDPRVVAHVHDGGYERGLDVRALPEPRCASDPDTEGWGTVETSVPLVTIYTSGTTGKPTRLTKTAGQLWGEAAVLSELFAIGTDDCILAVVPHHHIYGLLLGILVPWCSGACLVRQTPLHGQTLADSLSRYSVTRLVSTPAHLRALDVLEGGSALLAVRTIFSSGAPLGVSTLEVMATRTERSVTEILGSTETGGIAWREASLDNPSPRWQPLPGVRVSADTSGRMWIDSPFLGPTDPRPYPGQDRISMRAGPTFEHLGRMDDVVKVGGKRLSLRALEERLLGLEGVEDAAVLSEPSPDGRGQRIRAAVVAPTRTVGSIRQELAQWFDPILVPRNILPVRSLPRESNGKIEKERLRQLWATPHPESKTLRFGGIRRPADDDGRCEIDVTVPEELIYFQGHFPGHPILPGVVQLEGIVLEQAQQCWPDLGPARRVVRLKFRQTVVPGDRLRLSLQRDPAGRVGFELSRAGQLCSSGTLEFGQEERTR